MNVIEPGIALLVNALLLFAISFYFYARRHEPLGEILWWLMLASGWWSLSYGLKLTVHDERFLHPLLVMFFLGVMTVPVFWFLLAYRLTRHKFIKVYQIGWLFLLPGLNFLLLISNPTHRLFYKYASFITTSSGYQYVWLEPGPILSFSHLIYSSLLIAAGLMLLIRMLAFAKNNERNLTALLLLAAIIPFMLNVAWVFGFRPFGFLDTTPFGFLVSGLLFASLYNRLSKIELKPFLLDTLFDYQTDPVMVLEPEGNTLLYANRQGEKLYEQFKQSDDSASGLDELSEIIKKENFSFGGRHYRLNVYDLSEGQFGRKLRLVNFHDITALKRQEANLSALTQTIATFGNDINENISRLLALLGQIFEADAGYYNKKIGQMLITASSWNAPPGYCEVDKAEGHICNEIILQNKTKPAIFTNLQNSGFFATDPNVGRYGLNTYLGVLVRKENKPFATLCMVFTNNRSFSESELQLLSLASFVVSNEEERQLQLRKINETEINLRAILENSLDSIWSVDRDFRITYVNETFKKAYKEAFNVELREGVNIIETLPTALKPLWQRRYEKALKGEHYVFLDSVPINDEVTFYIEVSVMPIRVDGQINGISFYGRNITEKYLAEQRLLESEKRLAELNAAKDRVFSIISHDLRSPFNNIIGLSEVIEGLAEEIGHKPMKEYASSILRVSKNTYVVLENLLHWSRVQSGRIKLHPVVLNLQEIASAEIEFQQYRIEQKLINIINLIDPLHSVVADAQSVAVIVRNLLSNAIKFSYSEGEIILKSEQQGENIHFSVQDFGCGISIEDQKALFQLDKHPSRRGTQNETGTGLGLILCKDLAEKNNGHLLLESRVGRGSTFTLVLKAATGRNIHNISGKNHT